MEKINLPRKRTAPKFLLSFKFGASLLCFMLIFVTEIISANEYTTGTLAPSLLIDADLNNIAPLASEQFCYKIRYRCASATEHCTDAYIELTLPEGMEVNNLPNIGGNIINITTSPGTPSGTYIRIDLESPASPSVPLNALAAGSSGIFSVCAKWSCNDDPIQSPAAGSSINIIGPTFNASGNAETASPPTPITVATFGSCPVGPGAYAEYQKHSNNWNKNTSPGGLYKYRLDIPAHDGPITILDTFPEGLCLSEIEMSTPWTLEVKCDNNWFTIPSSYNAKLSDWIVDNENAGSLNNLLIDPLAPPLPSNQTGCSADTSGVSTLNGLGYKTGFTGIRLTTPAGTNNAEQVYLHTILDDSAVPGTILVNCMTSSDTTMGVTCANKRLLVTTGPNLLSRKDAKSGLGDLAIPDEWPLNTMPIHPSLTKQNDDILWKSYGVVPQTNGENISGFSMTDTLPLGLTFDNDPVDGNWFVVAIADKQDFPFPYDPYDQPACSNPTFTTSLAADGRMILDWNFNTCTFYTGFPISMELIVYFTTRYDKTIALPNSFENESIFRLNDGTQVWCGDGFVGQSIHDNCIDLAVSIVEPIGGDINSSKWVEGLLDTTYSRFPNTGLTDTSGIATYELIVEVTSLEGIEKLEIVDILSHVGDSTLTTRLPRNSEWSTEIAGALTVEKFDILTQSWSNAAADISSELYATTYNPCYLDATAQVKTAIGLTEPSSAGCSSTDFSPTNPIIGAKAFALIWENATDPLMFGELLRIKVPVKQLNGEANVANGKIASNSFALTATETDGDELFSSEPLKVNLQMLDLDINASFGDYIWMDANANGIQDVGEAPISGVTVSIFDIAGNPISIGGSPMSTISDANGMYFFSGLDPNTDYIIRLDNPLDFTGAGKLTNLVLTTADVNTDDDIDSDAVDANSGGLFTENYPEINVTTGGLGTHVDNFDFGFYQTAFLCGYAWEDLDTEGDQDNTELPMDSVLVELYDIDGNLAASATTDSLGGYEFELIPALYTMQVTFLGAGGYVFTSQNQGPNDNEDSDVDATGFLGPIILEALEYNCNNDIGLKLPPSNPASIAGTVWDELINNGIQSTGEEGVAGIQVNLLDDLQFVIATTYTDANGNYIFDNLEPNLDYAVNVVPGINNPITQFQDAGGDDTVDSDVDPVAGNSFVITPLPGEAVTDVDAGIVMPYSIGNLVWLDANNNGLNDPEEGVVANVLLYLFDASTGFVIDTTVTDVNGKFVFTNLTPGDYFVECILPVGITSSNDLASSSTPNAVDNDDNGVGLTSADKIQSSIITIVDGAGNPGDPNWIETDHGQPINGGIDNTSNPKAYYTLDFGLQHKLDCSVPLVQYAITNGAISKPGQTTNYFYQDTVQNLKTYINHVPLVKQDGVIRCFDFCEFGNWRYYYNPMDPEEYLFAIENGANVTPIEYIELRVDDVPSDRYVVTADDATYVMARDWFVRTVNDAPLEDAAGNPASVNIRFYFPEEEFKEILDEAIAQATLWNGNLPTIADVYWFKRTSFDPDNDIDATGSLIKPHDITTKQNTATSAIGVNTNDGVVGETGNGKNHIQFNGITGFSGGTAAITINKIALPVSISSFNIQDNGCDALLNWSAESETDFSHYIIEKSANGVDFEYVQEVMSLQLEGTKAYSYTDENVNGKMFYRLKLINLDGTYTYTNILLVNTNCINPISNLKLYPNPIGIEETNLNVGFLNNTASVVWVIVSNIAGTELMKFPIDAQIGDNTMGVDISNLVEGTYLVTLQKSKGKAISDKFIRVKK